MMMVGRRSKKLTKIHLISKGPHGASTLRGGHCHTCDSSTLCIRVRPDAHTRDSSTPRIRIGPNAGPYEIYEINEYSVSYQRTEGSASEACVYCMLARL